MRSVEYVSGIRIIERKSVYWFTPLLDANGRVDIGRTHQRAIRIRDLAVSRRHCEIVRKEPGSYVLRDLGSRNGFKVRLRGHYGHWIKYKRGAEIELVPGIHVKLGRTIIVPVDADGMCPINARDHEEMGYLANEIYGSKTRAAEIAGRSRHWVSGVVKKMLGAWR